MKASVERLPGHRARLDIEVDADRIAEAVERAYRKVRAQVQIPGFRKGRAPRVLVERHVGTELLQREALEELIPTAYQEAVQATDVEPVDAPEFDLEELETGQPLRFSAEVTVKPEVELPQLDELVAEWERINDSEERVEEYIEGELERLRQEHATLENVAASLDEGLLAVIDCHGHAHGQHYDALSGEGIIVGIGTGGFLPGFDRQLIGAAAGDERVVEITLPQDLDDDELAGAEARFDVQVREVKERRAPELDDAFAAEVSDEENLEDLKDALRKAVREALEEQKERAQREAAVAALVEATDPELPEAMIRNRVDELLRETEQEFGSRQLSFAEYLTRTGQTRDELAAQLRPRARREAAAELVLDTLCRQAGLLADDDELEEELERIGQQVGRSANALRRLVLDDHHLAEIRASIGRQKAVRHLVEQVTLREVEPDPEAEAEEPAGEGAAPPGREDLWVPGT